MGPSDNKGLANQLTEYGRTIARPEHDLLIYVAGALLTLVAVFVAVWCWRRQAGRPMRRANVAGDHDRPLLCSRGCWPNSACSRLLLLLLRTGSPGIFRSARIRYQAVCRDFDGVSLLLPGAVALVCAAIDLKYGLVVRSTASASASSWRRLRINKFLLYAVPALHHPGCWVCRRERWRYLAGQIFLTDWCHHLNFFMMGPAISFSHGKAFGTEIYSQYGIGWPLLASMLSHFWALTYGNLVGMEIVYSCIYYLALFFLLRTCFKQQLWAAFGVVLAIYWQTFSGMKPKEMIWRLPLFHSDAASDGCLVLPGAGPCINVGEDSSGPRWPALPLPWGLL